MQEKRPDSEKRLRRHERILAAIDTCLAEYARSTAAPGRDGRLPRV